ncbi:CopG family ribbon-helix-helix protein [Sphingomonas sp. NPDC092331]|jgi:predicted transcriptional regulator|uniref:CopG family ribbon-helix-helix protein n=1 Tax=unclassified Sphingomonas TaxID=196159 RepID=UPI0031F5D167
MSKSAVVTARLDHETLDLVDKVAAAQGRTRADFAAEAIRRVAESEADFMAFVQVGIDAAERDEVVPHAEVMAELEQMIEKHRARCRS